MILPMIERAPGVFEPDTTKPPQPEQTDGRRVRRKVVYASTKTRRYGPDPDLAHRYIDLSDWETALAVLSGTVIVRWPG